LAPPQLLSGPRNERAISVDLVSPARRLTSRSRAPSRAAPPGNPAVTLPNAEMSASPPPPNVTTANVSPHPAAPPTDAPQQTMPASLALRKSIIGCSFEGMIALSEAGRGHCHDLFAAGAKDGSDRSRFSF
jgi:hypothetical protein